jgi:hypothetical protein
VMLERGARGISSRLRELGTRADLRPGNRLAGKVPLNAGAVSARLRRASGISAACRRLAALGGEGAARRAQSSSTDPTS